MISDIEILPVILGRDDIGMLVKSDITGVLGIIGAVSERILFDIHQGICPVSYILRIDDIVCSGLSRDRIRARG